MLAVASAELSCARGSRPKAYSREVHQAIALRVDRDGRGRVRILDGRKFRGGEVIVAPAFIDGREIEVGAAGGAARLAAQRPACRRVVALPVRRGAADDEPAPAFVARREPGVLVAEIEDVLADVIHELDGLAVVVEVALEDARDLRVEGVAVAELERGEIRDDEAARTGGEREARREGEVTPSQSARRRDRAASRRC